MPASAAGSLDVAMTFNLHSSCMESIFFDGRGLHGVGAGGTLVESGNLLTSSLGTKKRVGGGASPE